MSPRTTFINSAPGFAVDAHTLVRNSGRQIDWAAVNASYIDAATGKKRLPAGTIIGDTGAGLIAERVAATRVAIGILATEAIEGDRSAASTGYGVLIGGVIYGNLLPGGMPAGAVITELNAAGTGFVFETYADNRAS